MALYPTRDESTRQFLRRTNTRLVISGGETVAEAFLVDPNVPEHFHIDKWEFSEEVYSIKYGEYLKVLIPKGRIVSLMTPPTIRGKKGKTLLTICNGGSSNAYPATPNYPVGIAPYHYFQNRPDEEPQYITYLTNAFIELPYVGSADDAAAIKTGVAYGTLVEGDYVTCDALGRFTKYTGSDPRLLVGRVVSVETSVPPAGWLEWVMLPEDILADYGIRDLKPTGSKPSSYSPDRDGGPYPYDPNYAWPIYQDARGIEFLSDGRYFGNVQYTDEKCLNPNGTIYVNTPPAAGSEVRLYVQNPPISTKNPDGTPRNPIITIKVGTIDITQDCTVDYKTGEVIWNVKAERTGSEGDNVTATYFRGPGIPGIPRNWDEPKALGAVRIKMLI